MKVSKALIGCSLALILFGCASGNKTDLDAGIDPEPAVTEAADWMIQAEQHQADLLSSNEYATATQNLSKAQKGLAGNYETSYILDKAQLATASFQQAIEQAKDRTPNATGILQARRAALNAGLRNSEALVEGMADVDDDLRDDTDNFSKNA